MSHCLKLLMFVSLLHAIEEFIFCEAVEFFLHFVFCSCCSVLSTHCSVSISSLQAFVPRVLGMYFIAALALIFYVSKVPERYFPGETIFCFPVVFKATVLFFT